MVPFAIGYRGGCGFAARCRGRSKRSNARPCQYLAATQFVFSQCLTPV
jgi:hypothetical protein